VTVLALDASTARGTVAVIKSGTVIAEAVVVERSEHAEPLLPAILALPIVLRELTGIVCGAGPGGFTGLRTAAAIAKGLSTGLSIPLYAVPSLPLALSDAAPGRYVVVLDAGRGERFASLIDWPSAEGAGYVLIPAAAVAPLAKESGARVVGPETGQWPHARGAARLAWGDPVDLGAWEPDYGRGSAAEDRRRAALLGPTTGGTPR
jgi:tRNA threonylcarbamoyl adenosine modification protein YeaZ